MKKLLLLIGLLNPINTNAFTLTENPATNRDSVVINLNGEFDRDSYKQMYYLLSHLRGEKVTIVANSPGGLANQLPDIMKLVHYNRVDWVVPKENSCNSACAWAAIGAEHITGRLGFHCVVDVENSTEANFKYEIENPDNAINSRIYNLLYSWQIPTDKRWFTKNITWVNFS